MGNTTFLGALKVARWLAAKSRRSRSLTMAPSRSTMAAAFSSPCLFSAQHGVESYLDDLLKDSLLPLKGTTEMDDCVSILNTFLDGE